MIGPSPTSGFGDSQWLPVAYSIIEKGETDHSIEAKAGNFSVLFWFFEK